MKKMTCLVIIPSNRNQKPVILAPDNKWGLVELPSGSPASDDVIEVDFDIVYENIIKEAINQVNNSNSDLHIECIRGQDLPETGDIVLQLIRQICTADITITDITANNPNVFLEYGIRLSLKDSLNIMIRHEGAQLPFDVEKLRCISYSTDLKVASKAKKEIASFIQNHLDQIRSKPRAVAENSSFYKRFVELYSGRHLERELIDVLETAPNLVSELVTFLFGKDYKEPHLKQKVFKFFDAIEEVLKTDPAGYERAINHLELVSNIKGLPRDKLQEVYYKLSELCDAVDALKEKAEIYRRKVEELEE